MSSGSSPSVPFARRLLAHRPVRTAIAVAGIAFAVLFMFLQLGFFGAVTATAVAVSGRLDADLVLVSSRYLHVTDAGTLPRERLVQAQAVPGVARVTPLLVRYARLRNPETGSRCSFIAIGFPTDQPLPLRIAGVAEQVRALEAVGTVLADRVVPEKCGALAPGTDTEVRERRVQVAGRFTLGIGFLGDGALLTSRETFGQLYDGLGEQHVHLGLIKLADGARPDRVEAGLRSILPPDTAVLSAAALSDVQRRHWVRDTALGNLFGIGVVVGFLVGLVVLYQVLSADVRAQLPQYATLKAMGYPEQALTRLVLRQGWLFAAFGYLPALAMAAGLFAFTRELTLLPLELTAGRAAFVGLLCVAMCTGSALLSLRRLKRADPAELF